MSVRLSFAETVFLINPAVIIGFIRSWQMALYHRFLSENLPITAGYTQTTILRRNPLGKRVIRTIGGQKSQDALRAQLCLLSQLSRISLSFTMTSGYKQTEMERRRHLLRMYGEKK